MNKNTKHITPPKGWNLVQWAGQCWKSSPAAERKGKNKQQYIAAMLLYFRGMAKA